MSLIWRGMLILEIAAGVALGSFVVYLLLGALDIV
jgi:hypothetical protein